MMSGGAEYRANKQVTFPLEQWLGGKTTTRSHEELAARHSHTDTLGLDLRTFFGPFFCLPSFSSPPLSLPFLSLPFPLSSSLFPLSSSHADSLTLPPSSISLQLPFSFTHLHLKIIYNHECHDCCCRHERKLNDPPLHAPHHHRNHRHPLPTPTKTIRLRPL